MTAQQIADQAVRQSLSEAFNRTGDALLERRPTIKTGTVVRLHLAAVRAYLERAGRE